MSELLILIPLALLMGLAGLGAFLWAMRSGQFDDLDGAGSRILFDEARNQQSDSRKSDKSDK
jgi:cbb3-type cytochrome oxidase maturation protein